MPKLITARQQGWLDAAVESFNEGNDVAGAFFALLSAPSTSEKRLAGICDCRCHHGEDRFNGGNCDWCDSVHA